WYDTASKANSSDPSKVIKLTSSREYAKFTKSDGTVIYNTSATCYKKAEPECDYEYFQLTASDTCGASNSVFTSSSCLYSNFQNHKGNTASASYYYNGTGFLAFSKISSTSETCTTSKGTTAYSKGTTAYQTLCEGVRKGGCGAGRAWVSNGCTSTGYTAIGGGGLKVEGAEFGTCECDNTQKYYTSSSDCTGAGYSSCKQSGTCYAPTCKAIGKYDTLSECQDDGNSACESYSTGTSSGTCYAPAYFDIRFEVNISPCQSDGFNLGLKGSGANSTWTFLGRVGYGSPNSASLPKGTYTLNVSEGNGYKSKLEYFSIYRSNGGTLIDTYAIKESIYDNGYRTTSGVSACGSSYGCLEKTYTFAPHDTYVVKAYGHCAR
ncbi:MAG: hypothetical protein J6J35_05835, partial [Alphaproteobacteria bacterium]|nr:hypothetical protein [Alphaproteobacteria bacterium]